MAETETGEGKKKKSGGMVMTIAGLAVLTLLGAGGGWAVGNMVAPNIRSAVEAEPSQLSARLSSPILRRIALIAPFCGLRIQLQITPATATGRICGR